jgi:hypothetical protein
LASPRALPSRKCIVDVGDLHDRIFFLALQVAVRSGGRNPNTSATPKARPVGNWLQVCSTLELVKKTRKEGEDALALSHDFRVLAAKCSERLKPFGKWSAIAY